MNAEIEKFTTKKLSPELLSAAWDNLTFTVDPIASSLGKSASDAQALGLLKDPADLSKLYDLTLLNEILQSQGQPAVKGLRWGDSSRGRPPQPTATLLLPGRIRPGRWPSGSIT